MVFFTCSHCGESVKKPAVAKHYQTKCRKNEPFLTCVDCLKDFKGNEYEAHTKCVTEDERYSAKGYVPKPSQNKGERKQQAWQECIQTVLKKPTLKQDERDLISAISKYENVPRKKAKFINFLSNAFRQYANRKDLIDRVWTEMESVFKEAASTSEDRTQQEGKTQEQDLENPSENSTPKLEENGFKKEKKRKRQQEEVADSSETGKTDGKVKKKKHKSKEEIPTEDSAEINGEAEVVKEEKKNRKRKKAEENGLPQSEENVAVPDDAEPGKKKKKKKHDKNAEVEAEAADGDTKTKKKNKKAKTVENESEAPAEEVEEGSVKKKKKKGKKSEDKENCAEKGEDQEEEAEKPKKKKTKGDGETVKQETFDWKETILNVLNEDGKNKKIQLQKLQKKVLKRHCRILNCENSEKKEKKFMKKLKEMPQIEIDNDFVVLKS